HAGHDDLGNSGRYALQLNGAAGRWPAHWLACARPRHRDVCLRIRTQERRQYAIFIRHVEVNALGGYTGAILLAGFALYMVVESVGRFIHPVPISFNGAIFVAVMGLMVNGVSVWITRRRAPRPRPCLRSSCTS